LFFQFIIAGTFNIGRKDRLWKNYHRLRLKFGKDEFSFLPRTFCLPSDTKLLRRVWERKGCRAKWIVKPPALARGTGITVINKWSQVDNQFLVVVVLMFENI
jgi:tubulin polyglutamylase TTLL4